MLSIHLCTLISWSPTSHRLDLCTVMKPTEVFIHVYVQCNSCIWKFTVIHVLTKAFYTFINFLAYPVDLVFFIEEHCWSVFFFKIDVQEHDEAPKQKSTCISD